MNISFIVSVLLFVGAAQGMLLSIALFSLRRGNRAANRILACLLFVFSSTIFFHTLGQLQPGASGRTDERWLGHAVFLLFGPLMYYYATALTKREFCPRMADAIHLLPFAVFVSAYLTAAWLSLPERYLSILAGVMFVVMVVQMLSYLFAVLRILRAHSSRIRERFSSLERINLRWLRTVTIGQVIIWSVAFVVEVFKHDSGAVNIVWLLVSVFMYMVGYFGISQPEIFAGQVWEDEPSSDDEKKKYEKSSLSPEQAELILKRLSDLMQSEKPHLNSTLTLPSLSKQLSVSTHHLSRIINERLGQNFFEFVNRHRIEEAKRLLTDPSTQNLTLAAIGYEAGFNSVSSFNSIFKKLTSLTPSQYRSSALEDGSHRQKQPVHSFRHSSRN